MHEFHSHHHQHTRMEPAAGKGNGLASMDSHYTETHNYGSTCARKGLATTWRASLAIQTINRGKSGLNRREARAPDGYRLRGRRASADDRALSRHVTRFFHDLGKHTATERRSETITGRITTFRFGAQQWGFGCFWVLQCCCSRVQR